MLQIKSHGRLSLDEERIGKVSCHGRALCHTLRSPCFSPRHFFSFFISFRSSVFSGCVSLILGFSSRKEEVIVDPHMKLHITVNFIVVLTSCLLQCSAVTSVLIAEE